MPRFRYRCLFLLLVSVALLFQLGCGRREKDDRTRRKGAPRAKVVLDAGHGGQDAGACVNGGRPEKEIVLDITLQVERLLRKRGFGVILTRRMDEYVSLWKRARIANDNGTDLFVSIHANSCPRESVTGFEIYYANNGSESQSLKAARFIQGRFAKATGAKDRGIRNHRYLVLTQTRCPSVLVEVGYLSNRREAKLLYDKSYRKKVARGIADGITDYLRNRD